MVCVGRIGVGKEKRMNGWAAICICTSIGILRHWLKHVSFFLVKSQWVATFSPRDSLSNFLRPSGGKRQSRASSPLGLPKEFFLLLRQYEEEMLDVFL